MCTLRKLGFDFCFCECWGGGGTLMLRGLDRFSQEGRCAGWARGQWLVRSRCVCRRFVLSVLTPMSVGLAGECPASDT